MIYNFIFAQANHGSMYELCKSLLLNFKNNQVKLFVP